MGSHGEATVGAHRSANQEFVGELESTALHAPKQRNRHTNTHALHQVYDPYTAFGKQEYTREGDGAL